MKQIEAPTLSIADIHAIEARAHEMRAEALADAMRSLGRGLRALALKFTGMFFRPRHA
ncbi:hypothetical protein PH5382_00258 [Phaeobacter sp. CECT 5382]|uniref:RSP_7527 family protein n=1 Tax=Rhodobacterales TaxID=204455 RepID=UPI0006DBAE2D|nr:hypothetical protein [Phaeobacter sp. CECT 5382]CUH86349.1 hypothetical protein PH5382_00258 [Phaeobacter sp. CECT 5382]